jgi:hypothetical protein
MMSADLTISRWFDSRTPRGADMEHRNTVYALVARQKIHDFTLR